MDWVNIVGFVAMLGTMLGIIIPMIHRLDSKIDAVDKKFEAKFDKVDEKFVRIDEKIEKINYELMSINRRLPPPAELVVVPQHHWNRRVA